MTFVLDACAIIALLRNEAGAEITDRLLLEQTCMAHAVNLCEVYYDFLKAENENVAQPFRLVEKCQDRIYNAHLVERNGITTKNLFFNDYYQEKNSLLLNQTSHFKITYS
jgi:PIN domain nuclease of toxin-antitoxin system